MRTVIRLGLLVLIVGYSVALAHRNDQPVPVDLIFRQLSDVGAGVLILGSLLLGAIAAALLCSFPIIRMRLRQRRSTKRISELEQELHGLRTLPLTEDTGSGETKEA